MRGAIVRDTFLNLENTTRPSILEASHNRAVFYAGGRKFRFLNAEIDMFGVDDLASLSKFQGAGYSFVWLEEPAPMEGRDNAGLQRSVFDVALSRIGSQREAIPRLQITMNPADEDHWTYEVLVLNPINTENYRTHVVNIPYESNPYIGKTQREAVKLAYKDNPANYQRYVEGKFSYIQVGEAVTPEYNEGLHRSKDVLIPNKQFDTFRFWDGGLNPTCVFMQITPRGRLLFLDTVRGENIGMKQLLDAQVIPLINQRYHEIKKWRDIGDPALVEREQSDSTQTAADVINKTLGAAFEPGEKSWQNRREAMKEMFNRNIDGMPMVCLSKNDLILHRCFRGGWHYQVDNSGRVLKDKPIKDIHSHPGDAVSHGIGRLLMSPKIVDRLERLKQITRARWGIGGIRDIHKSPRDIRWIK